MLCRAAALLPPPLPSQGCAGTSPPVMPAPTLILPAAGKTDLSQLERSASALPAGKRKKKHWKWDQKTKAFGASDLAIMLPIIYIYAVNKLWVRATGGSAVGPWPTAVARVSSSVGAWLLVGMHEIGSRVRVNFGSAKEARTPLKLTQSDAVLYRAQRHLVAASICTCHCSSVAVSWLPTIFQGSGVGLACHLASQHTMKRF